MSAPRSLAARIAAAALAKLRADDDLREYFAGRLDLAEHEDVLRAGSLLAPSLYVTPDSWGVQSADGLRVQETVLVLYFLKQPVPEGADAAQKLERTDRAAQVLDVLFEHGGVLYADVGTGRVQPLTQALESFEQGSLVGSLAGGLLLTPIRVTFTSLPHQWRTIE